MSDIPITEADSPYRHLELMEVGQLIQLINQEDQSVAGAVKKCLPQIEMLIQLTVRSLQSGGRIFYIGAGTSGRLGILDASECPPTFGVPDDWVIGLIAGGDHAIRKAIEFAEDDTSLAWKDLEAHHIHQSDIVIGIAASGTTPYVIGGLKSCRERGIATGCITCNPKAPLIRHADAPVVCEVGPEFITGSTRMKAGTAQKMILNMITTTTMIKMKRVVDNKMVDMQLANEKLIDRGARVVSDQLSIDYTEAKELLLKHGSVRAAIESRH